jgi:ribonuclease BN (tRNA processing enzyme)
MRATIWGCRGSLAAPGGATVRYGGNTSCVEVRLSDGTLLVLDAGTGIRALGTSLVSGPVQPIHLLLTHLHLDHLEGLGFFEPLWRRETELHLWGPPSTLHTLEERISRYLSPPLFPISLADSPAQITFHDVASEQWQLGTATLQAVPVAHPGPTLGYRIEEGGATFAYVPDHEPALGAGLSAVTPDWISGYAVAAGADVLLHDAQFLEDEYPQRIGWGHSSVAHAVSFALAAEVAQLVLFHHDPIRDDDWLDSLGARARELWNGSSRLPQLAYEGMRFDLVA